MVLRSVIGAAVLVLYYLSAGVVIRKIGCGEPSPTGDVRPYNAMPGPRAIRRTWSRYGVPDDSY